VQTSYFDQVEQLLLPWSPEEERSCPDWPVTPGRTQAIPGSHIIRALDAPGRFDEQSKAMAGTDEAYRTARRLTLVGMGASALLAFGNITVGWLSHSTSVAATGFEFAGDVLASCIVFLGMGVAARPADAEHPYGHGRVETLSARPPRRWSRWHSPASTDPIASPGTAGGAHD
jgi:hypothetical protein